MNAIRQSRFSLLVTQIRWFHLPLTFATTFVALQQLRKYRLNNIKNSQNDDDCDNPIAVYKASNLEV